MFNLNMITNEGGESLYISILHIFSSVKQLFMSFTHFSFFSFNLFIGV